MSQQKDEGKEEESVQQKQQLQHQPGSRDAMNWLLRELRPVSYNLKTGAEGKRMRFGFIADEIEQVLPQVVRTGLDSMNKKGIVYPDLIAVLTSMVQELSTQMKVLTQRIKTSE